MERHCKNCNELIYAGKNHCANCGCKWIENRITMKQVGHDFADMYIGIDTKFVRTFIDLFKKPEAVILGYMNGRRVNYMDAVRYLLLALFVTGIYTFILKNTEAFNIFIGSLDEVYEMYNYSPEARAKMESFMDKYIKFIFDFQGFFILLTIPLLALIARITFWGKRYFNFTEQIVFYMYTYGHSVIVTTPFTIMAIFIIPESFSNIGYFTFPLMYLFNMYCYKRSFKMDYTTIITKTFLSIFVSIALIIGLMVLSIILGILAALVADKFFGFDMSTFFR